MVKVSRLGKLPRKHTDMQNARREVRHLGNGLRKVIFRFGLQSDMRVQIKRLERLLYPDNSGLVEVFVQFRREILGVEGATTVENARRKWE